MKKAIWVYLFLGGRENIIKIAVWEVLVFVLLVLYRLLGYITLGD